MELGGPAARRLLVACALGGAIGLEREWRHKDSGLRTNMLICMGSALFTIMSEVLAGASTPNKGQVAANIVQGIGFLGAGLILHTKSRVLGLTTAATVFVVAAIGMTCGAGMYMEAVIATVLLLAALQIIGAMEFRLGWKPYPMVYEVRAEVGAVIGKEVVGAERAEELARQSGGCSRSNDGGDSEGAGCHRTAAAGHRPRQRRRLGARLLFRDGDERISTQTCSPQLKANDATDHVVVFDLSEVE